MPEHEQPPQAPPPQAPPHTERFEEALAWAVRLHRDQHRKGSGAPYISHLLAVTALVIEHGGDEDVAIAAVLHDAVEDQGGAETLAEIERRFGGWVAAIVDGCSDTDQTPKPPWRERKEAFLASLPEASPEVKLVVAADKLHNSRSTLADLRSSGPSVWDMFHGGREGSLWYYRGAVDALRGGVPDRLIRELAAVVDELDASS